MKSLIDSKMWKAIFLVALFLVVCLPDSALASSLQTQPVLSAKTYFHVYDQKLSAHTNSSKNPISLATLSPTGLSPTQIRKAYNLPSTGGVGTIAIIDAYDCPTAQNDFVSFSTQFGLPTTNFEIHKMASNIAVDATWALETSLDVQWAHAIAPNAKILLVEAQSNSLSDLFAAVSYATNRSDVVAVSMSWGTSEFSGENTYDSYFNNSNGIVFFASSGDSGAGVIYPSTSPNVVAVGGTRLTLNLDGSVASETGWSGSGGGVSAYETQPQYQLNYTIQGANGKRAVPDVSYNADPASGFSVYDTTAYQGQSGWFQLGGTSAGAPQWAAIHSLGLSTSNVNFYHDAKTNPSLFFRDVISGSNGAYSAQVGYDFVTGLGSPLTWNYASGGGIDFSISALPGVLTLKKGDVGTSKLALTSLNGFSGAVSLSVTSPDGWVTSLNSSSSVLAVEGSNSSSVSVTVPQNAKAGRYNFTVTGTSGNLQHDVYLIANVQTVPSAPSSLTTTINSQVSLDWTAPTDNGGLPITVYTIYRGVASEAKTKIASVPSNILHYDDLSSVDGQTYTYQVTANNSIGESVPSNQATVTMQLGVLNVTANTDQPRYFDWSYIYANVTVKDGISGVPLQGALVNVTVSDPYGRIVWSNTGVTDNSGKIQFLYKLVFDAQMGTYVVNASASLNGYLAQSGQTTFFSLG